MIGFIVHDDQSIINQEAGSGRGFKGQSISLFVREIAKNTGLEEFYLNGCDVATTQWPHFLTCPQSVHKENVLCDKE